MLMCLARRPRPQQLLGEVPHGCGDRGCGGTAGPWGDAGAAIVAPCCCGLGVRTPVFSKDPERQEVQVLGGRPTLSPTLEATQGQILSQVNLPQMLPLRGSICMGVD